MRLHISDAARLETSQSMSKCDDFRVPIHTRRGETHLVAAVVVKRRTFDHRVDAIAVRDRIRKALEHDYAATIAEHGARRVDVERAAVSIGRSDATLFVEISALMRERDRHSAGERHVATVAEQALNSLTHRNKRSTARRIDANRRAAEIQFVRRARGHIVLLVPHHRSQPSGARDELRMVDHVVCPICVIRDSGEHADGSGVSGRVAIRILERGPGFFQKCALLRVDHLGLARRDSEKCRVKVFRTIQQAAPRNVRASGLGTARTQRGERLLSFEKVAPELRHISGTGKAAGHADNCDTFK